MLCCPTNVLSDAPYRGARWFPFQSGLFFIRKLFDFVFVPDICSGRMDGCRMDCFVPICENRDFRRAYTRGKSFVTPVLVVYVVKNRCRSLRVGITTSKKTGNAVKRSRSRRVIREALRALAPDIKQGYDLILVARAKTPFVKSTEVQAALRQQLEKAGILL